MIRQRAVERFNRACRVYMDNCAVEDWVHAKQLLDDAWRLVNQYHNEWEQSKLEQAKAALAKLEQHVQTLGNARDERVLQQLEAWDKQIDKRLLPKYPELESRYKQVSQAIAQQLAAEQDEQAVHRYNKRALREIKRAYNLFQRHERKYKKGEGIGELTALLGGWDTNAQCEQKGGRLRC